MTEPIIASKQMIKEIYDGAAKSYDCTGPNIFARYGAGLVSHLPIGPGSRLLDVATGKGAVVVAAARRVAPGGSVVGVDLSEAMLVEASRIVEAEELSNVDMRCMDAEQLEMENETFDAVTCAFGLFMFTDIKKALREMWRVCKAGGCLGLTDFNKVPRPFDPGWPILLQQYIEYGVGVRMPQQVAYSPGEVEALVKEAGFSAAQSYIQTDDLVYADEEDWWQFQMTVGPRLTIMGMDEQTRSRFKAEYLSKLRPLHRSDGLHIALGVIYTVAER